MEPSLRPANITLSGYHRAFPPLWKPSLSLLAHHFPMFPKRPNSYQGGTSKRGLLTTLSAHPFCSSGGFASLKDPFLIPAPLQQHSSDTLLLHHLPALLPISFSVLPKTTWLKKTFRSSSPALSPSQWFERLKAGLSLGVEIWSCKKKGELCLLVWSYSAAGEFHHSLCGLKIKP